ncbi:Putative glyoxylase CFP32 [Arthrobacter sp. Bi26]|uniref:VOC family protein n=1 Tax=Arthrobacter sp. Bi26 TaxID=2822350 RepID=UPI001DD77AE4|nr:VOC family protein [Arthrobacter sp. Bi26]CAH0218558.1 Putative glyoxylase CFP32 [Arthrobacter sp. Bi26]
MTARNTSSVGAPCWVDTLQPDPRAARDFYGPLFGWSFDDPTPMPSGFDGDYYTARLGGRLVAGIGQAPPQSPPGWITHVRVDDIGEALARAEQAGGKPLGQFGAGSGNRIAMLADATGVPFCLRQAGENDGAERANEPNTWAMSSLHTTDIGRAQAFYGEMFDWVLESVPDAPFSLWLRSGQVVAVVTATDGVAVPPHWSVNFAVRDADAIAEHAVALGGGILMAPMDTPGFRSAVIRDPQGGTIAVSAPAG